MTEIKVSVTLNGDIDLEKIAKAIRKEIECAIVKVEIAEPEPLKVGDYAKVVGQPGHYQNGTIVEVDSTDYSEDHPFGTKNLDGSPGDIHSEGELIRATDEEVAEAKRKQAENAEAKKWSKIGRKPNEFKKGDIVRVMVDFPCGSTRNKGYVGAITHYDCEGSFCVGEDGGWMGFEHIELVTPVEARFDR
jgi:hypothetical protein